MGTGAQNRPGTVAGQKSAHGQAARDALGEGDRVGEDAVLLKGKERTRAADPGLYLVHQQQPVPLGAEHRQIVDEVRLHGQYAALALYQLQHDGAHIVARYLLHTVHTARPGIAESLVKGEKVVVEHVLPGGGQGGDGTPVEGIFQGNDGPPPLAVLVKAVFAGQLDDALVAFRAGVCKESRRHTGAGAQLFGQLGAGLGIKQVGHMPELRRLGGDGVRPLGVCIPDGAHADAGGEVDVLPPRQVVQGGPCPMVDVHIKATVGLHDIPAVQRR